MKNLLIILAAFTFLSCKKEDKTTEKWKLFGVSFSVYSPDSTKFVSDGSIDAVRLFRDEKHYNDFLNGFTVVGNTVTESKYPPLYSSGNDANPLDVKGLPSGTYYVEVRVMNHSSRPKTHFKNKFVTYNANDSDGHTDIKLYLERGYYSGGVLIY